MHGYTYFLILIGTVELKSQRVIDEQYEGNILFAVHSTPRTQNTSSKACMGTRLKSMGWSMAQGPASIIRVKYIDTINECSAMAVYYVFICVRLLDLLHVVCFMLFASHVHVTVWWRNLLQMLFHESWMVYWSVIYCIWLILIAALLHFKQNSPPFTVWSFYGWTHQLTPHSNIMANGGTTPSKECNCNMHWSPVKQVPTAC